MSQDWGYFLFKLSLAEALEEVATSITEEAWLYNEYAIYIGFDYIHWFNLCSFKKEFLKSSRPSLPLKKAPPFSPSLSSIVFTTPSVPLVGDRNPQGREDVTALQCYICPTCPSPTGGSLPYTQALNPYHWD